MDHLRNVEMPRRIQKATVILLRLKIFRYMIIYYFWLIIHCVLEVCIAFTVSVKLYISYICVSVGTDFEKHFSEVTKNSYPGSPGFE